MECLYNPSLRGKPVSVCGSVENRHGIVLASTPEAKKFGIKTGEAVWQARQKCRDLVVVEPHYERYQRFSQAAHEIYADYSPCVEPFGLDECWLDVTGTDHLFGSGKSAADAIRARIKAELGITASVGVSYNKIFAKLGSDMKKPDATTVILPSDYQSKVWELPASDLLYVGPATESKLHRYGINTIGQLACSDLDFLCRLLGKWGITLWRFANGLDSSPVSPTGSVPVIKSIGNSTTCPRDLTSEDDIRITTMLLAESVAARLREQRCKCRTVQVWIHNTDLSGGERQVRLPFPSYTAKRIGDTATGVILKNWQGQPVRGLGVRAQNLVLDEYPQLSLLPEIKEEQKQEDLEIALDHVRRRFGHFCVQRGIMLTDTRLSHLAPKDEHTIHPVSFFQ